MAGADVRDRLEHGLAVAEVLQVGPFRRIAEAIAGARVMVRQAVGVPERAQFERRQILSHALQLLSADADRVDHGPG